MSARTQRHAIAALLKALEHCEDGRDALSDIYDGDRWWDERPRLEQDAEAVLMAVEELVGARTACAEAVLLGWTGGEGGLEP